MRAGRTKILSGLVAAQKSLVFKHTPSWPHVSPSMEQILLS